MPINNNLFEIIGDVSKDDGKGPDPGLVDKLFSEWRSYHSIRILFNAIAWALGMATLLLA